MFFYTHTIVDTGGGGGFAKFNHLSVFQTFTFKSHAKKRMS